ncbi:50S ribosomal protein L24 [Candidatus Nomurabacteria bacterium]|nr:50S ribosomal protein L24 [Candidatus Nomurabacteria bacterium]
MKIKTGDNVKILAGKERGKTGKVIQVIEHIKKQRTFVVVEGLNTIKKHIRTRKAGEKGQVIELSGPIDASNVMLIDPKSNKPTRVGLKKDGDKKLRVAKRTGESIE